jgi:general secretion pathway protein C
MGLSEYRDTLMQNPQQLADLVQARPYHRNGISGYQINPGRDPALFSRLGLQANDVITMVNGVRLDNPARGLSILQSLRERTQVTVEVVRNGTPQTLSIDLNQ